MSLYSLAFSSATTGPFSQFDEHLRRDLLLEMAASQKGIPLIQIRNQNHSVGGIDLNAGYRTSYNNQEVQSENRIVTTSPHDDTARRRRRVRRGVAQLTSLFIAIANYFIQNGFEISLLLTYKLNGDDWYFYLSLAFSIFPAVVLSYLNLKYYNETRITQRKVKKDKEDRFKLKEKILVDQKWKFLIRRCLCFLLISKLAR